MVVAIWIIVFIAAAIVLSFNRASLIVWTISYAALLILVSVFCPISTAGLIILWLVFLVPAVILNVTTLRRWLFTRSILLLYRKVMPHMSVTEREALTAGNVGWEGEIFTGMPNWDKLRAIPQGKLSDEEQAFLDGPVEELCGMISNWDINQRYFDIPQPIWDHLKKYGYFGLIIPKAYGGKEFSALAHSQIITKLCTVSVAVGTVASVPNSLGPGELLLHYGTEQQKNHYLPRLARGEDIPCFALTSPVAGSDASSIADYGVICRHEFDGKEQLAIRLHWKKRYITLSPVATLIGLAFKLYDPDHLFGTREDIGITCALIPANTPGVKTGRRHYPLCCAFPNGPTEGHDVLIPMDWIIGGPKMAGHGWRMLMESLAEGRSISLPSMVCGGSKRVLFASGAYARIREQFHTYIGAFGGVQEALACIGGYTYLMEATRLFTVTMVDRGIKPAVASAISKCHTTEMSRTVLNRAMDVHGGKGICMGPHNYVAQTYIECPISITVEGANILTRSMIIFGQGAIRCHPYVLREMMAAQENDESKAVRVFDKALFGHIGYFISNATRAFWLGLSKGRLTLAPRGELKKYYQQFSQYAAAFAFVADMAMISIGGKLKRKERLSGRLGDLLSFLYLGSAAIKFYELNAEPEMLPFVRWACEDLLYRIQTQLHEFLLNMPARWLAGLLRMIVFPLGRRLKPPSDRLGTEIANLLVYPSRARERLSQHVYIRNTPNNPIGLIETVLNQVIAAEPLEKKLREVSRENKIKGKTYEETVGLAQEARLISAEEAHQLLHVRAARMSIINVDDFALEEITRRFVHEES